MNNNLIKGRVVITNGITRILTKGEICIINNDNFDLTNGDTVQGEILDNKFRVVKSEIINS